VFIVLVSSIESGGTVNVGVGVRVLVNVGLEPDGVYVRVLVKVGVEVKVRVGVKVGEHKFSMFTVDTIVGEVM
jgi:hypothetical protein